MVLQCISVLIIKLSVYDCVTISIWPINFTDKIGSLTSTSHDTHSELALSQESIGS